MDFLTALIEAAANLTDLPALLGDTASRLSWREVADIGLVALIYYRIILFIKGTRAVNVAWGLVFVILAWYISGELGLYTFNWLLANFLGSLFLVTIILFQRDIRRALAEVGTGGFFKRTKLAEEVLEEIVTATASLAVEKTGALIIVERSMPLGDVLEKGVEVDARVSRQLLVNLFCKDTPLHDGAVVIRGDRIAAASCILPLSPGTGLPQFLGTRHRAAIGLTEESDAVAIVVSEERGEVSMAIRGRLSMNLSSFQLRESLQLALKGA